MDAGHAPGARWANVPCCPDQMQGMAPQLQFDHSYPVEGVHLQQQQNAIVFFGGGGAFGVHCPAPVPYGLVPGASTTMPPHFKFQIDWAVASRMFCSCTFTANDPSSTSKQYLRVRLIK